MTDDAAPQPELRILTDGLSDEEVAAVTSVVSAAIAAQRAGNEDGRESLETVNARRWRRSVGPFAGIGTAFDIR